MNGKYDYVDWQTNRQYKIDIAKNVALRAYQSDKNDKEVAVALFLIIVDRLVSEGADIEDIKYELGMTVEKYLFDE